MNDDTYKRIKADMSSEAIDRRLKDLAQLYKLGMAIRKAKRIGKFKNIQKQENEVKE